jgi:hypothetical protein
MNSASLTPELLFFTCANEKYEDFVPLYAYFALRLHQGAQVEFGLENAEAFLGRHGDSVSMLRSALGHDRIVLREVPWRQENGKRIVPNTVRFLVQPMSVAKFVYIGDIDIILLEPDFLEEHKKFMDSRNLPYSNSVRPGTRRMSGLHMSRYDSIYPLPDLSDLVLEKMNDEMVLYEIVHRCGLPIQDSEWFRPVHGIHISPNRSPGAQIGPGGELVRPGWGVERYVKYWRTARSEEFFIRLRPTLSQRVRHCIDAIDLIADGQCDVPWPPSEDSHEEVAAVQLQQEPGDRT